MWLGRWRTSSEAALGDRSSAPVRRRGTALEADEHIRHRLASPRTPCEGERTDRASHRALVPAERRKPLAGITRPSWPPGTALAPSLAGPLRRRMIFPPRRTSSPSALDGRN